MFKQPLWIIPFGHYLGNISILIGLYLIIANIVPGYYLLVWLLFHVFGSLMLSVGLHRYFAHGSFKTSKFWHTVMAYYSVILLNGSPQGWAAAHNTHHKYSDTERDPHYANWHYIYNKKYRQVPVVLWRVKALTGDKTLEFIHRYGLVLWLLFVLTLVVISPTILLFAYLMPLGSTHLIGAIHQITSHRGTNGPRDLAWLEFLLPACGEWLHKTHHDYPRRNDFRTKWWHFDLGALFIKCIRSK